jgi:hypothetical protein
LDCNVECSDAKLDNVVLTTKILSNPEFINEPIAHSICNINSYLHVPKQHENDTIDLYRLQSIIYNDPMMELEKQNIIILETKCVTLKFKIKQVSVAIFKTFNIRISASNFDILKEIVDWLYSICTIHYSTIVDSKFSINNFQVDSTLSIDDFI